MPRDLAHTLTLAGSETVASKKCPPISISNSVVVDLEGEGSRSRRVKVVVIHQTTSAIPLFLQLWRHLEEIAVKGEADHRVGPIDAPEHVLPLCLRRFRWIQA